jgi:nucleolar protein 58
MKFEDITEAMAGATALVESKLSKPLKKFLKSTIIDKNLKDKLAIADAKLGSSIKSKLGINCVHDQTAITELMRGIRQQVCEFFETQQR